jgi:hypothetical protein
MAVMSRTISAEHAAARQAWCERSCVAVAATASSTMASSSARPNATAPAAGTDQVQARAVIRAMPQAAPTSDPADTGADHDRQKNYPEGVKAALYVMSGGGCYRPGCGKSAIWFVGGVPEINLQSSHIHALEPGGPRKIKGMSLAERNAFPI